MWFIIIDRDHKSTEGFEVYGPYEEAQAELVMNTYHWDMDLYRIVIAEVQEPWVLAAEYAALRRELDKEE